MVDMTKSFPEWVEPMAATLTQERFTGPEWIFERKFDGIRLLAPIGRPVLKPKRQGEIKLSNGATVWATRRCRSKNPRNIMRSTMRCGIRERGPFFRRLLHLLLELNWGQPK